MMKVLAFDLGASSGRAMLGAYDGASLRLDEIHRFPNEPVRVNGRLYWDVLRLFQEMKAALAKCAAAGHTDIASIGIDTWGVDYGLLDCGGQLLANPRCYRDSRTRGMHERLSLTPERMFFETGIQPMEINTAYQLASEPLPENADKLLFMPDLLGYFLTGEKRCEKTILSTSQLFDVKGNAFTETVLRAVGIDRSLLCPLIEPGTVLGTLTREISLETGMPQIPVVSVAGHDTASAVAAIPFVDDKKSAFLSCGTWSLLGAELPEPVITKGAFETGFTNELGFGGTARFLKNIVGLWIAQQCRERWKREGQDVSYEKLNAETAEVQSSAYIDPNAPLFTAPPDMPGAIARYCGESGQAAPQSRGEYLACILRSLAMEYRRGVSQLENVLGYGIGTVHMTGGGTQNKLLCQYTASATGKSVIAGPAEATAAGNMLVQMIALGGLEDIRQGREVIKNSFELQAYAPRDTESWNAEYGRYLKVINI